MKLSVEIVQKQTLSHQLIQSMNILQMSAIELNEFIEKSALENPVIELADTAYSNESLKDEDVQRKLSWLESTDHQNRIYYNQEKSDELTTDWYDSLRSEETLIDYLKTQLLLSDYTETEKEILDFIIESLDERGYLPEGSGFIADYFVISKEKAEALLQVIKQLDPAGVGAKDLSECLLLQLHRQANYSPLAEAIIKDFLPDIAKNHIREVAGKLNTSIEEVTSACDMIKKLNPKPSNSFNDRSQMSYIKPDAVVVKVKDYFEILINEYEYPNFSVSQYYTNLYESTKDTEAKQYLQQKISQANWIQSCIKQRSSTLSQVLKCIVEKQQDFFLYGPGHKHPLRLSDIASELNLHESTISRALKGKHLQCSHGIFPLNYFLTSVASVSADSNEGKTSEEVNKYLKEVIDREDKKKPLSDQAISEELKKYDIHISRRTVNKYRTALGIPDKSGRKDWKS